MLKNIIAAVCLLAVFCLARQDMGLFSAGHWSNMFVKEIDGQSCLVPRGHSNAAVSLNVQPDTWYEISFDVYGDSPVKGLLLSFDCFVRENGKIIVEDGFAINAKASEWCTHSLKFLPKTASPEFVIYSRRDMPEGLPLFFRNFKCEETMAPSPAPLSVRLTYPEFKDTIFTSVPLEDLAGTVTAAREGAEITVCLTKAGEEESLAETKVQGGNFQLPGTKDIPAGKYTLHFSDGQNTVSRQIQKLPPSPSEACRYQGHLYHNGKPIVFSGPFKQFRTDAMVYGHARNGMQVFFSDSGKPEDILKELDIAQRFGCKIILWLRTDPLSYRKDPAAGIAAWQAKVRKMLTPEIMAHPALLAYAGQDELGMGLDPLEEWLFVKHFIEELDPHHPLWVNDAPAVSGERARKLSAGCDIYGIDIYPAPKGLMGHAEIFEEKYLPSVGLYVDLYSDIMKDKGIVWMILQGFAWRGCLPVENVPPVYPTALENRHMAFESFVAGSQANIYWGLYFISAQWGKQGEPRPFYDNLLEVCRETAQLEAVWLNGAPVRENLPDGLRMFRGQADGATYTIVVNDTENDLDCQLATDGLYVLPGGAPADTAILPPYGVRVYATVPAYPAKVNPFPEQDDELDEQFKAELEEFLGFPEPEI